MLKHNCCHHEHKEGTLSNQFTQIKAGKQLYNQQD